MRWLVQSWTMRSSDCSLIISSSFFRIFSLGPPGKLTSFTLWLKLRPFSEKLFTMDSSINTIFFFLLEGSVWVSVFWLKLELGLEFPFSVSTISSFSVTVFYLPNLCYYYFQFSPSKEHCTFFYQFFFKIWYANINGKSSLFL